MKPLAVLFGVGLAWAGVYAGGCSSPASLLGAGKTCEQTTDCAEGLVCIPQGSGRVCSSNLMAIEHTEEAGAAEAAGGGSGSGGGSGGGGSGSGSSSGGTGSSSGSADSGMTKESGTEDAPTDTGTTRDSGGAEDAPAG